MPRATLCLLRLGDDKVVVRDPQTTEPELIILTSDATLNYAQVKGLHQTLSDWLTARRLDTPGKTYDHDPKPDDSPEPGDHCRTCGEDITWIGPSMYDYLHVDDKENR